MCERLRPPVNMETFVAAGNLILTLDEGYQAVAAAGDSRAPGELGGISDIEGAERRLGVEQSRELLTVGNGVDCRFPSVPLEPVSVTFDRFCVQLRRGTIWNGVDCLRTSTRSPKNRPQPYSTSTGLDKDEYNRK